MTRYSKAFADKVGKGYKTWEAEVILKGSTPEDEATKYLAGLKLRGKKDEAKKDEAKKVVTPAQRKKPARKKFTTEDDSKTAEEIDAMSLRDDEEPEDMDVGGDENE